MSHPFLSWMLLASAASALAFAQTTAPTIRAVPLQQTSPASGQQMYATYCAVCHGTHGTGDGPAAPAMNPVPADLTTLSLKSGGKFPYQHIASVLQFGVKKTAHGTASMPVWGDLMLTLPSANANKSAEVHQRITNLTDYLKQIQR